jgi:hypothetical protein
MTSLSAVFTLGTLVDLPTFFPLLLQTGKRGGAIASYTFRWDWLFTSRSWAGVHTILESYTAFALGRVLIPWSHNSH